MAPIAALSSAALPVKDSFEKGVDAIVGAILILATAAFASNFSDSRKKLKEVQNLDPAAKDTFQKIKEARSTVLFDGLAAAGTAASTVGWAFTARILPPLGIASAIFNGIGYGVGFVVSSKGVSEAAKEYQLHPGDVDKRRLALIDMASKITSIAWAILGTVSIISGAVPFVYVGSLLIASFGVAFIQGFYKEMVKQRA